MKPGRDKQWLAMAAAVVVAVAGAAWLCRGSADCPLVWALGRSLGDAHQAAPAEDQSASGATARGIEHADAATFEKAVLQSSVPVLVDFYADWCGPCRAMGPVLEELAEESPHARIVKINVDENEELATRYGIEAIPTLLLFKDGQIADKHLGLATKADLLAMLQR